ncbi:pentatricopeptide repeat-containing protein At2g45350, chloroplastic [Cucurbita maxima]|uniref:Pentatricopeptide repeat-containing protein At2g45350, chloroplastic n=1 Tax=Cucurbita maxima TaxID=3661 RepID=A0A6J1ID28_CUCMA|nr:pentatricopeptide repeat-containing protein At2g45350, chloroplastic [Cucurbita maxima]
MIGRWQNRWKREVKTATPYSSNCNSCHLWPSTPSTLLLLRKCETQNDVNQIHARIIKTGQFKDSSLVTKIILNSISSPNRPLVEFARYVFFTSYAVQRIRRNHFVDDPFLWNAVIKSYSHGNDPIRALVLFCMMLENGFCVDKFSFSLILKACARVGLVEQGKQIHGFLMKLEIGSNLFLLNCLIALYIRCGEIEVARQVFDRMPMQDSVSYNSMIDGYVKCGLVDLARELFDSMPLKEKNLISWNSMIGGFAQTKDGVELALELFEKMPERDLVSWNTIIGGFAKCGRMEFAHHLFDRMPKRDVISWSNMIDGYAKLGDIEVARNLFDEMPEKDVVAYNAMMAGYTQNGYYTEALEIFYTMQRQRNLSPEETTLAIAFSAVSQLGHVEKAESMHSYLVENGFSLMGKVGVGLIDMYSKCGSIENAMSIFRGIDEKGIDHWNAMISGMARNGLGELAFEMLMEMQRLSVIPDDITFIGVLNACAHAGLVKEGTICFELMRKVHKLEPKLQHYGCMVDILGKAGLIERALKFIEEMPIEPNDIIWRTLLSACQNHENFTIGEPIAKHLMRMDSCNSSSYVLLSNIYTRLGLWSAASKVRTMMKKRKLTKIPGCSWIELKGVVHEFLVHDKSHPLVTEIYFVLDGCETSNLHDRW